MLNPTPDFREGESLLVAGIGARYTHATKHQIPALWARFVPLLGKIPHQTGMTTYGVCFNPDGHVSFDYLCAVPVSTLDGLSEDLLGLTIPPARYAVFDHGTDLSTLAQTWRHIYTWLPTSGFRQAETPYFERYSPDFCAKTGHGSLEIWIPIEPAT